MTTEFAKQARRAARAAACWRRRCCAVLRRQLDDDFDFHASRVIAFGDEIEHASLDLDGDANGRKFSVNGTVLGDRPDDRLPRQPRSGSRRRAASTAFVFPGVQPGGLDGVRRRVSRIRATVGARAADLGGADRRPAGRERRSATATWSRCWWARTTSLAQYRSTRRMSEDRDHRQRRGRRALEVGRQVNRLADTGAKVLLSTILDVGLTPFAIAERAAHADTDRAALL